MTMKSTTVRGTPVNYVGPKGAFVGNAEGRTPGVPANLDGTSLKGYGAEQSGYRLDPRSGTPYQDSDGNPDEARRVAFQGRSGVSPGAGGVDMNDPAANGRGVILDRADDPAKGYQPPAAPMLDSPVPSSHPNFDARFIPREDAAHLGSGNESATEGLVKGGGVMSRD
jgi:hypothetical protein